MNGRGERWSRFVLVSSYLLLSLLTEQATVCPPEMTNMYLSAYPANPLIRGAIMQSSDSTPSFIHHSSNALHFSVSASQPQWQLNSQLTAIAANQSCPTSPPYTGQLDCLRGKDAFALQNVLLATGNQFQPVIDNITIWKDYVKQTREGRTARVPLLIGTNKVSREATGSRVYRVTGFSCRMKAP